MTADTAVLIPAREKLSIVLDCLEAVLARTTGDFHVYVVDVGYPQGLLAPLERLSGESKRISIVGGGEGGGSAPVLSNAALNLALDASEEPFVCVVENDVIVSPEYWSPMREMLGSGSYDLVSPTIMDGRAEKIHFDPPVSDIEATVDGGYRSELVRRPKDGFARVFGQRRICHLEKHSFAGTREAMERLQPFDEQVTTRTDIDLSLTAFHMGLRIGMCPSAEVTFYGPPISDVDQPFFAYRWDLERAEAANEHLVRKWKLKASGDYLDFVHEMRAFV